MKETLVDPSNLGRDRNNTACTYVRVWLFLAAPFTSEGERTTFRAVEHLIWVFMGPLLALAAIWYEVVNFRSEMYSYSNVR